MIAASEPVQRSSDARLLVVRRWGRLEHWPRAALVELLQPGDLLVANDAATLPASLAGVHVETGRAVEVRLAGRGSLEPDDVGCFLAVLFGAGDFRTRTEDRALPPALEPGDRIQLGPLRATIERLENHRRLVWIRFGGSVDEIWSGLARHGRPIQYAHVRQPLALWDVWTPIAGPAVAFEAPSAGFALSWETVSAMRSKGVEFATLTHAAGISSTGDPELDARLPFDEPYRIPRYTADAIGKARRRGGRVIAVGTTVVRALEDAALGDGLIEAEGGLSVWKTGSGTGLNAADTPIKAEGGSGVRKIRSETRMSAADTLIKAGTGLATRKIGRGTRLRVVDALLSGTHERGTSHYELLRAFLPAATLEWMEEQLDQCGYRTHEFGDSILVEKSAGFAPLNAG
jgi:S-adenosylmethionine:tRNA ribosyltransferase-isomerase